MTNLHLLLTYSAGVGRTGTLIAIDIIIQRLKQEKKINIYELVKQLRTQRVKMVQSMQQYLFIYRTAMTLVSDGSSRNWRGEIKTHISERFSIDNL